MNHEPAFPALPISRELNGELVYQSKGLTIRDYFAAKAMQSYVSHNKMYDFEVIAAVSFRVADAMLEARK